MDVISPFLKCLSKPNKQNMLLCLRERVWPKHYIDISHSFDATRKSPLFDCAIFSLSPSLHKLASCRRPAKNTAFSAGAYISHCSMFILPDLTVCSQLGWPMLNDTHDAVYDTLALCDHVLLQLVRVPHASEWPAWRCLRWEILTDYTLWGRAAWLGIYH